jgi:prevent-host-death family protein
METVRIAQLKNNLSAYLNKVRSGQELIVQDRDVPVARIIPWNAEADELADLAGRGLLHLGGGPVDDKLFLIPAPKVDRKAMKLAIEAERLDD